ncbi:hypothetical protein LCGC14_0443560 [marine sediment metagenome]|uniref:DNA methylase N-4/N-6 domain-containing protein n=1 Tax=marine sediment metagenome TaxID=412755 RepID=A0A0F9SJP3_9ZZZZ
MAEKGRRVRVTYDDLDELAAAAREGNPKAHNLAVITESVDAVGYVEPVVMNDADGKMLAGHGRIETLTRLREMGASAPEGVRSTRDGRWLVPTIHGVELSEPDAVPDVVDEPYVLPGQLYALGPHRILCGSATDAEDVACLLGGAQPNLMVTDPPYGVNYDPEWRNDAAAKGLIDYGATRTGNVPGDDRADWGEAYALAPGDVAYIWHAGVMPNVSRDGLLDCGYEVRNQIVWAKPRFAISRGHYNGQHGGLLVRRA